MGDVPDGQGLIANLILAAEWAARESRDKIFNRVGSLVTGASSSSDYTVPAGSTLYVVFISCVGWAITAADRDNNQGIWVNLENATTGISQVNLGTNFGFGVNLSKPVVIPAENIFRMNFSNIANHNIYLRFTALGFEV